MNDLHTQIIDEFEAYLKEHNKFEERGIKVSGARARKALGNLSKLAKSRRAEIQEKKNSM